MFPPSPPRASCLSGIRGGVATGNCLSFFSRSILVVLFVGGEDDNHQYIPFVDMMSSSTSVNNSVHVLTY